MLSACLRAASSMVVTTPSRPKKALPRGPEISPELFRTTRGEGNEEEDDEGMKKGRRRRRRDGEDVLSRRDLETGRSVPEKERPCGGTSRGGETEDGDNRRGSGRTRDGLRWSCGGAERRTKVGGGALKGMVEEKGSLPSQVSARLRNSAAHMRAQDLQLGGREVQSWVRLLHHEYRLTTR